MLKNIIPYIVAFIKNARRELVYQRKYGGFLLKVKQHHEVIILWWE